MGEKTTLIARVLWCSVCRWFLSCSSWRYACNSCLVIGSTVDSFGLLCNVWSVQQSSVFHYYTVPSSPDKPFLFRRSAPYKIPTSPPILGGDIKFILQPGARPRHPSTDTALPGHHNIRQHFPNQNHLNHVLQ